MNNIYWTGIGSRETPISLKSDIKTITELCNDKGFILRSGGADGADSFFEEFSIPAQREIYLPWKGFNNNSSLLYDSIYESYKIAEKYHPAWGRLSFGAKKLMSRNVHQILGKDLDTPSKFVVCWTKDGKSTGGTGQALRISKDLKIPIFNLKIDRLESILKFIEAI